MRGTPATSRSHSDTPTPTEDHGGASLTTTPAPPERRASPGGRLLGRVASLFDHLQGALSPKGSEDPLGVGAADDPAGMDVLCAVDGGGAAEGDRGEPLEALQQAKAEQGMQLLKVRLVRPIPRPRSPGEVRSDGRACSAARRWGGRGR